MKHHLRKQSPVSAAAAIKNILNASKSVGSSAVAAAANATQNSNSGVSVNCTSNSHSSTTANQGQNCTTTYSNIKIPVNATAACGISISLGIGSGSGSGNENGAAATAAILNNCTVLNFQNGNDVILSPQTLQQITGSPGRARDRNLFHSPTASAAVPLPLLRGFTNNFT